MIKTTLTTNKQVVTKLRGLGRSRGILWKSKFRFQR